MYIHHSTQGICVHGRGHVNSRCNTNRDAKLNSNPVINNNLFACFNYTLEHKTSDNKIVPTKLHIKIGVTTTETKTNIKGRAIFEEFFAEGEELISSHSSRIALMKPDGTDEY